MRWATAKEPLQFSAPEARPLSTSRAPEAASPVAGSSGSTARWAELKRHKVGAPVDAWQLRWQGGPDTARLATDSTVQQVSHQDEQGVGMVRQAVQLQPADPFADPFADAVAAPAARNTESAARQSWDPAAMQSPALDPPAAPAPDEFDYYPVDRFAQEPGAAEPQPLDPDLPGPPPADAPAAQQELPPGGPEQAPGSGSQVAPSASNPDCDRIYNDRNCCDEADGCKAARARLQLESIRSISLDITPQFTVAKLAANEGRVYQEELEQQLSRVPARIWRNRRGEVVAEGLLANLKRGEVIIQQPNGETVSVPFSQLSDDDTCFVTAWWSIPSECTMGDAQVAARSWLPTTFTWKASALCHKPLYFEEVQLERYGHTAGPFVQPVLSGAHFFLNVAALPYQMGISPPHECEYALGYYRPGNCAPWLVPPVPLSVRAALLEAGVITGGIFLIP